MISLSKCTVALLMASGLAFGQSDPTITEAELRHLKLDASLSREVERLSTAAQVPTWLMWTVPTNRSDQFTCCWNRDKRQSSVCHLESNRGSWSQGTQDSPGQERGDLRVLVRLERGRVDEVRGYSADCELDFGGHVLYEVEGVGVAESVRFLSTLVALDRKPSHNTSGGALGVISNHKGDAADEAFVQFTSASAHRELRAQAAFWLGVSRGRAGFERLRWMMRHDSNTEVKEQVIFALTQSGEAEATELLFATARNNENPKLRSQALFWLGQQAGEKATDVLTEAVRDDPDAEVREQAVFALSQLPADEGVPLLIGFARKSRHPEVRRTAMFWLGQSNDPRALDLFEEILLK